MAVPSSSIFRPPADPCLVRHPVTGVSAPPLVTTFNSKKPVGVHGPPSADDWRLPPGAPGNDRKGGARPIGAVRPLVDAIRSEHDYETYAVSYHVTRSWEPLPGGSPRVCKTAPSGFSWLPTIGHEVTWDCLGLDLDNPHRPGSTTLKIPNDARQTDAWCEQLSRLDGWGWYITENGARLWRPLETAITDGSLFERVLTAARAEVDALEWESFGQPVKTDAACKDMSRLMSLAYIVKKGRRFYSPVVDLSQMTPGTYAPAPEEEYQGSARRPPRAKSEPYQFVPVAPEFLVQMLRHIGPQTLDDMAPGTSRHDLMRAVAGALIARHFEPELVPVAVEQISFQCGLDRQHTADDFRGAKETVENWQSGVRTITGMATLRRSASTLARAIDVLASTARARHDAETRIADVLPSADEASDELYQHAVETFASRTDLPLVIIGGTPGTGKSRLALRLMTGNAAGKYPGHLSSKKAHLGQRSVIAPPTQEVAVELQESAARRGVRMIRWTSGLSEREADGTFTCPYRDQLVAMAEGGLSAQHHGCGGGGTPCPEATHCRAALGCIDPEGHPVDPNEDGFAQRWPMQIATQARLPHALAKAGQHAKVIVDEKPETVKAATITHGDLEAAVDALWESVGGSGMFDSRYAAAMLPAVYAAMAALEDGDAPLHTPDAEFTSAMGYTVPEEILALAPDRDPRISARMAPFPKNKTTGRSLQEGAPFVKAAWLPALRTNPTQARRFSRAGRVCSLLWRALQPDSHYTATIVVTLARTREFAVFGPSEVMELLIARTAPRLLLTADAELVAPEIGVHFSSAPQVHPVYVRDGAPVDRRLVMHPAAKRSKSFVSERLAPGGRHLELLQVFADWALEAQNMPRVVLVTWKVLAVAVRAALGLSMAVSDWTDLGQRAKDLEPVVEEIRPTFKVLDRIMRPSVAVLHYGATRGVDAYRDHDALAMLGVPYPNVGAVRAEADHLAKVRGLDADQAAELRESLAVARARAEFGQAAGRLRGPRRRTPARILCVSDEHVLPAEWERHDYERRDGMSILAQIEAGARGGRPKNADGKEADARKTRLLDAAARAGSRGRLASVLGLKESRVKDYAAGRTTIPADVDAAVQKYLGGGKTSPIKREDPNRVGFPTVDPERLAIQSEPANDTRAGAA